MTGPIVTAYLAENDRWLSEGDAASISRISDAAWRAVVAALDELNGCSEPGIDCGVATTAETLADFDATRAQHWSERGSRSEHEFGGLKAVKYERLQLRRGQPRRNLMVIDVGDFRVALT